MVNPDFRDLFAALNEARANYLVVGAHAVARPQDLLDVAMIEKHG